MLRRRVHQHVDHLALQYDDPSFGHLCHRERVLFWSVVSFSHLYREKL